MGNAVYRECWEEGRFIKAHFPQQPSMKQPYMFERCADGKLAPWIPTQEDILIANDWVVKPKKPRKGA